MLNWTAAPAHVAAGQAVGDRVAGQPGGDHGEPALGAQCQPLQSEVAGE